MKTQKIIELLDNAIRKKEEITVYIGEDKAYYNLIPLERSDRFVLAAKDIDFHIDGFIIFEICKIRKLVGLKSEKYKQIMQAEGVLDDLVKPEVSCKSFQSIFKLFCKTNTVISLYTDQDAYDQGYFIGRVEKVKDKSIRFSHFDAEGEWYGPAKIRFKEIDMICFGDRYGSVFSKYVGNPENNK